MYYSTEFSTYIDEQIKLLEVLNIGFIDSEQGLAFNQLVDHLREIYKEEPNAFDQNQLKTIKHHVKKYAKIEKLCPDEDKFIEGENYLVGGRAEKVIKIKGGITLEGGLYYSADLAESNLKFHRMKVQNIKFVTRSLLIEQLPSVKSVINKVSESISAIVLLRYQEKIKKFGLELGELIKCTNKPRITHCFSCKCKLDSRNNLQCSICHWILCACGSCGCTFSRIEA